MAAVSPPNFTEKISRSTGSVTSEATVKLKLQERPLQENSCVR